jgi:hypothetical protein
MLQKFLIDFPVTKKQLYINIGKVINSSTACK